MRRGDRLETLDVFIGAVGFFAFAFLVITVVCEVTGTDALAWALTVLALLLVLACLLLARRNMVASRRRAHDQDGENARP
ncbi:MAG TPA: hypothetical protein VN133_09385 [Humibacter sp.]|jgi:hypothetical protein|nr:hypothetical protein [Humibacter sp.]